MKASHVFKATVIFLLFCFFSANAQIENEIMNYTDSTELIMNNGQKLLIQSMMKKDYDKTSEVYYYLQEEAIKQGVLAFSYTDILYINLISRNWNELFYYIRNYNEKSQLPAYNSGNELTSRLYTIANDEGQNTVLFAEDMGLDDEHLSIIKLIVKVIQEEDLGSEYKKQKEQFRQEHSNSEYLPFVNYFLPDASTKISWSWGMGPTLISPTGNYGKNFSNSTVINMFTDFNVGDIYMSLYMNGGNINSTEPFEANNHSFEPEDHFSYFDGGIQLGYFIVNSSRVHVAPYANIGGASLRSNIYSDDQYYDNEFDITSSFIYGIGFHSELKLFEFKSPYSGYWYGPYFASSVKNYLALKVNIGYNAFASSEYDFTKGNVIYSQFSIVWGIGEF